MPLQRWQQVEELYHSACEHGVAVLDGADPEIRKEVERLLAHNSADGDMLLDQRAADLMSGVAAAPITPGSRIGPYQIEAAIGEGGMGQVFRAKDTRLSRAVAIKVCKEEFIDRFEQEARSIAVISHPNICTLYDVGPNYLVMELVEGETLAARLKRGKLTPAETIRYGAQIAEGLAVAHAQGIVHRDLKPGNIMLTKSGVKVLDFGLAKSGVDPTVTAAGAVMGTPAYLPPERLDGKEADARSDIYALGLVLMEMLAGKRSAVPDDLPPALDRVIKRCLEPDPEDRWQSARDLKWELESTAGALSAVPAQSRGRILGWALASTAFVLAVIAVLFYSRRPPESQPLVRLSIMLPEKSLVRFLAVSPDGRYIAAVLVKDGKQQIWMRALDGVEMAPLAGTENAATPFWSPDSRFIAFFADSKLKRIERTGGPVQDLCGALAASGGSWNRDGDILIGALYEVMRVSDQGGDLTSLPHRPTTAELFPVFLPDGHHFVAYRGSYRGVSPSDAGIWIDTLDSPEARHVLPDLAMPQIVAPTGSRLGAILFTRSGTLMALPLDMKRLEPAGEPFPVARGIAQGTNSVPLAASSWNGVLAYISGQQNHRRYVWRDRAGKNLGVIDDAGGVVMISPDGKKFVGDPDAQITSRATNGESTKQLTVGTSGGQNPAWSADGRYVAYNGPGGIYRKEATGGSPPELLFRSQVLAVPKSWSPDSRYLIFAQVNPGTGPDLFALPLDKPDSAPLLIAQTKATEDQGQFSPDGQWIAYTSNESGQSEIYVVPFPPDPAARRWLVSRGGGVMPRWRHDGKELFYISPDWKMMAVNVTTRPTFQSGTPRALFNTEMIDTGLRTGPMSWDVSPDGKRFLIISENSPEASSLDVILNWRPEQPK